jgi:hypothetical protein
MKYDVRRDLGGTGWQGMATFTGIDEAVVGAAAMGRSEALDNAIMRAARAAMAEARRELSAD